MMIIIIIIATRPLPPGPRGQHDLGAGQPGLPVRVRG